MRKPKRDPIQAALGTPKSRKLAIKAKCYDCQGQDADPGVYQRIAECPITTCPLWNFRKG